MTLRVVTAGLVLAVLGCQTADPIPVPRAPRLSTPAAPAPPSAEAQEVIAAVERLFTGSAPGPPPW